LSTDLSPANFDDFEVSGGVLRIIMVLPELIKFLLVIKLNELAKGSAG